MRITPFSKSTFAPSQRSSLTSTLTSSTSGMCSMVQGEDAISAAGMMATAAFLPPLAATVPRSGTPPWMESASTIAISSLAG